MSRQASITECITAEDVQRALRCSRSTAYEPLRRASGRPPDCAGMMLRVSIRAWERYFRETFEQWQTSTKPAANTTERSTTTSTVVDDSSQQSARTRGPLRLLQT